MCWHIFIHRLNTDKNRQEEFFDNYHSKKEGNEKKFIENKNKLLFDYNKAKKENNETIGAIYIPKTSIMFPIVKHSDNSYYLTHTFYKNYSIRGAIFMDFNQTFDDLHTMIYGHNLSSGDMFSELTNYSNLNYAKNHKYIYIWIKDKRHKYEVFSSFVTARTDYETYKIAYNNTDAYKNWLSKIKLKSAIKYDLKPDVNKNTVTLSTCTDNTHRQTIHLQMIK